MPSSIVYTETLGSNMNSSRRYKRCSGRCYVSVHPFSQL